MATRNRLSYGGEMSLNETDLSGIPRSAQLEELLGLETPSIRGQEQSKTFRRRSANVNLQKSLKLLDESISSPVSRPRSGLRHSSYTPRPISSGSKYDVSVSFTPAKTPQQLLNQPSIDTQLSSNTSAFGSFLDAVPENVTSEITTTNVALLLEEDPGLSACKGMYDEFLQCMKNNSADAQAFRLVEEYENVCKEQMTLLNKLVNRATRREPKYQKTFNMLHLLEQEHNTWQLIRLLFKDRLETELQEEMQMAMDTETTVWKSEQQIINKLFDRDQRVREGQLVVDWLESCSHQSLESYSENIKFFSDRASGTAVGWETTLHKLKNQDTAIGFTRERPLVTEIDPDAPLRQNRILDDLDKEDEGRLLQYLFICLRAGQLEKAQEVCKSHGQSWRAATLEGWKLHHNPNFEESSGQIDPITGNPYRVLWKSVCWNFTQEPRFDMYEKALYGVLSGNLQAMLPACKSWSDYLWAHFKVLVDIWAETEIRTQNIMDKSTEDLPKEYWEQPADADAIFHKIEAYEDVRLKAQEYYHIIQKWVILGNIEKLLEVMCQWVRNDIQQLPQHLIRYMAHLVLFLHTLQPRIRQDYCNVILEAYVEYLIQQKHRNLVSHYVSKLPPDSQVLWYARFLEEIDNKEERQMCLQLAEEANLDIKRITKTVVEIIRNQDTVDFNTNIEATVDTTISEEDRKKIQAIDWLVFDPAQRAEAVIQANAVMRAFIAVKKLVAAKEVFDKIPGDSVDVMYRTWKAQTGTTDLPASEENAIREYLCIKAYLDSMEAFNEWFNKYHHSKPTKPQIAPGAKFTEKVAHEHRRKQYDQEMDRWHHSIMLQTKVTKGKMYNVLLFADGGWMVDQREEETEDLKRKQQMESLRQLVIPGLCSLLHSILHTSEQYTECLQLADIIGSEQHQLYKVFRKEELRHLLQLLRTSSLSVLDQNRDPLGYKLD